jgi:hypothetical protein
MQSCDYDGDGYSDVAVANEGSRSLTFVRGGSGGLSHGSEIPLDDAPVALTSGDHDGDGFPDVVVARKASNPGASVVWIPGGPKGLVAGAREVRGGRDPVSLASGDFDSDGRMDVLVADGASDSVFFLRGTVRGVEFAGIIGGIEGGQTPTALAVGDYDGDGFLDAAVANKGSNDVTFLRQLYLQPHVNRLLGGVSAPAASGGLVDPRDPPRYRLELSPDSFGEATRVSLVPGPSFGLPQAEAFRRGTYVVQVTDPVTLLPETTVIDGEAHLTLRLRSADADVLEAALAFPERLRVFRRKENTGVGEEPPETRVELSVVDFEWGDGVRFSIGRFGSYVAAVELER